jgi:hypothetical protein
VLAVFSSCLLLLWSVSMSARFRQSCKHPFKITPWRHLSLTLALLQQDWLLGYSAQQIMQCKCWILAQLTYREGLRKTARIFGPFPQLYETRALLKQCTPSSCFH